MHLQNLVCHENTLVPWQLSTTFVFEGKVPHVANIFTGTHGEVNMAHTQFTFQDAECCTCHGMPMV